MPTFRKRPILVEAIRFDATSENLAELSEFVTHRTLRFDPVREELVIETLEGDHVASKGDWIIRGVQGECYPCNPDIFRQTYDLVED